MTQAHANLHFECAYKPSDAHHALVTVSFEAHLGEFGGIVSLPAERSLCERCDTSSSSRADKPVRLAPAQATHASELRLDRAVDAWGHQGTGTAA